MFLSPSLSPRRNRPQTEVEGELIPRNVADYNNEKSINANKQGTTLRYIIHKHVSSCSHNAVCCISYVAHPSVSKVLIKRS